MAIFLNPSVPEYFISNTNSTFILELPNSPTIGSFYRVGASSSQTELNAVSNKILRFDGFVGSEQQYTIMTARPGDKTINDSEVFTLDFDGDWFNASTNTNITSTDNLLISSSFPTQALAAGVTTSSLSFATNGFPYLALTLNPTAPGYFNVLCERLENGVWQAVPMYTPYEPNKGFFSATNPGSYLIPTIQDLIEPQTYRFTNRGSVTVNIDNLRSFKGGASYPSGLLSLGTSGGCVYKDFRTPLSTSTDETFILPSNLKNLLPKKIVLLINRTSGLAEAEYEIVGNYTVSWATNSSDSPAVLTLIRVSSGESLVAAQFNSDEAFCQPLTSLTFYRSNTGNFTLKLEITY